MTKRFETDLRRIYRRLGKSDTPAKRRNARHAMRLLIQRLERAVDSDYPPLAANGKVRSKALGPPRCPKCPKVWPRSWKDFSDHVWLHFPWRPNQRGAATVRRCWCGRSLRTPQSVARHFRALRRVGEDAKTHAARGAILSSAGVVP